MKASKAIRSKPNSGTETNWTRLRRWKPEDIQKGVAADPDAQGTDARFWKYAKVMMPAPKEIVTMRLDADLRAESGASPDTRPVSTPFCARICRLTGRSKSKSPAHRAVECPPFRERRAKGWVPGTTRDPMQ